MINADMLSDALESPDLDNDVYDKSTFHNHPVLKFFQWLSTMGIDRCVYLLLLVREEEKIKRRIIGFC